MIWAQQRTPASTIASKENISKDGTRDKTKSVSSRRIKKAWCHFIVQTIEVS